jgi:AraC-like DNA-binding protein
MRLLDRIDRCEVYRGIRESGDEFGAGFLSESDVPARREHAKSRQFALLYLLDGEGYFTDAFNRTHHITPGSFAMRYPEVPFSIRREQNGHWLEFFVVFPRAFYGGLKAVDAISFDRQVLFPDFDGTRVQTMIDIVNGLRTEKSEYHRELAKAHSLLSDTIDAAESRHDDRWDTRISKWCSALASDLEQRMAIPALVNVLGLDYDFFRRKFKSTIGMSPKEYRIRRRVELAKLYLNENELSVKETAYSLGYPDVASFCKQFKKYIGVTPSQYKDRHTHQLR